MPQTSRTSFFSFKWLFFSLAVAAVLGLGARIFLSPERVRGWIAEALQRQPSPIELKFEEARVELSRGALPYFAVVLSNVTVAMQTGCDLEPAITIKSLRVPVRLSRLISSELALGRVGAEDLLIDLDQLKDRCSQGTSSKMASRSNVEVDVPSKSHSEQASALSSAASIESENPARPWWNREEFEKLRSLVTGFDFERVELRFENRTKSIFLESFSATPRGELEQEEVAILTRVRVPPALTRGEVLPVFKVDARIRANQAEVELSGALSEGNLQAHARFLPAMGGLQSEIRMRGESVPLSKLIPLLTKANLASLDLKPRFIWLDCEISISGRFQRLFQENPLKVENCRVHGNGMNATLAETTRYRDGKWGPMVIAIENAELSRVLDLFGVEGPSGVASDYGKLNGRLEVKSSEDIRFSGKVRDAVLRFSNRSTRAQQRIESFEMQVVRSGNLVSGEFSNVRLAEGEFGGSVSFEISVPSTKGTIVAKIDSMLLAPGVQDVLVGGKIDRMHGELRAGVDSGQVSSLTGELQLGSIQGQYFRIPEARVQANLKRIGSNRLNREAGLERSATDSITLALKAPFVEITNSSAFAKASRQIFFADVIKDNFLRLEDVSLEGVFQSEGKFEWNKANATFDRGRVRISSAGSLNRNRALEGWLSVDYPSVKKLKWALGGELGSPILKEDSAPLRELKKRARINAAVLGLSADSPIAKAKEESPSTLMEVTTKTSKGIKELGSKVIQKARRILPKTTAKTKPEAPMTGDTKTQDQ